jgi:ClpP class serine protease
VLAADQVASALKRHRGKVTVFVPHYAMSGGALIAPAADEIVMDPNAVLGPVDPQLGTQQAAFPAPSILRALDPEELRSLGIAVDETMPREIYAEAGRNRPAWHFACSTPCERR